MDIRIPYGKEEKIISLEDERVLKIVFPSSVSAPDELKVISKAIENPLGFKSLKDFLKNGKKVIFIVNDATRFTPTPKVLEVLHDQLNDINIKFLVASGSHPEPTEEEYRFIFGRFYEEFKERIFYHDAKRYEDMAYVGTSKSGTEYYLNRLAVESDRIIVITSVAPHYFAGFMGGRKSFLPGISSYKTIEQNHKLALKDGVATFALNGNPVNEDMEEILNFLPAENIFAVQMVLSRDKKIVDASAGGIVESFNALVPKVKEIYGMRIEEKAEVVCSVIRPPQDATLYDSRKVMQNGVIALKNGGIHILVTKCGRGIGPTWFYELVSSEPTPERLLEKLSTNFKLGDQREGKWAKMVSEHEIWYCSDLEEGVLSSMFVKSFHDPQKAIDEALKKKGKSAKIVFLMDSSETVPIPIFDG